MVVAVSWIVPIGFGSRLLFRAYVWVSMGSLKPHESTLIKFELRVFSTTDSVFQPILYFSFSTDLFLRDVRVAILEYFPSSLFTDVFLVRLLVCVCVSLFLCFFGCLIACSSDCCFASLLGCVCVLLVR